MKVDDYQANLSASELAYLDKQRVKKLKNRKPKENFGIRLNDLKKTEFWFETAKKRDKKYRELEAFYPKIKKI